MTEEGHINSLVSIPQKRKLSEEAEFNTEKIVEINNFEFSQKTIKITTNGGYAKWISTIEEKKQVLVEMYNGSSKKNEKRSFNMIRQEQKILSLINGSQFCSAASTIKITPMPTNHSYATEPLQCPQITPMPTNH